MSERIKSLSGMDDVLPASVHAWHALEAHVATADLQVGRADSHPGRPDQYFVGGRLRIGVVSIELRLVAVKHQCTQIKAPIAKGVTATKQAIPPFFIGV